MQIPFVLFRFLPTSPRWITFWSYAFLPSDNCARIFLRYRGKFKEIGGFIVETLSEVASASNVIRQDRS